MPYLSIKSQIYTLGLVLPAKSESINFIIWKEKRREIKHI